MIAREYVEMDLNSLVPYGNNPRINSKAVEAIMASIRDCEYISPIVVDENNCILAGHTRLKAMLRLGMKKEQVLRVSGLTEEQKKKFRLLDNRTNEFATWDMAKLEEELNGLTFDFDFGFDKLLQALETPEFEEEPEEIYPKGKKEHKMKFGVRTVVLTERELLALYDLYDQYVDAYETPYGFATWLMIEKHFASPEDGVQQDG